MLDCINLLPCRDTTGTLPSYQATHNSVRTAASPKPWALHNQHLKAAFERTAEVLASFTWQCACSNSI